MGVSCTQDMRTKFSFLILLSRRRFSLRLQLVYKIVHNVNCPHQLICIYIFYFCIRVRSILQIFSIYNSFICLFFTVVIADHRFRIPACPLCFADRFSISMNKEIIIIIVT